MKIRNKRLLAIFLSAAMVFSFNTAAFAEEVEVDGVAESFATAEADETAEVDAAIDAAFEEEAFTDADDKKVSDNIAKALSGNVTIRTGAPDKNVNPDFTISVDSVKDAITEELTFSVEGKKYTVKDGQLYLEGKTLVKDDDYVSDYLVISLNKIRAAGAKAADAKAITLISNNTIISDVKGNELLSYTVTVDTKMAAAKSNTVEGEIFLRTPYSGTVSEERVTFGSGKYALVVTYDAAVEYRGSRSVCSSHYLTLSDNNMEGVDGAVGVGARLEVLSGNKWYPIDKDNITKDNNGYSSYYWKDDTGITLKKPACKNNKNVGSMYDENGPYFTIKMSYSKKQGSNELLSQEDKRDLQGALKSKKFHFTIEPRKIDTSLITYKKFEPNKYYVKKLTYNSAKNTLAGVIQYRGQKNNKSTINARKLKNVGKKLKIVSKSVYDSSSNKKPDVYFVYDSSDKTATLTGINGYYGTAVVTQNITSK